MGKRDEHRAKVEAEILRVGREHLATDGAAALSLRAIARDLGMVSSGIYRYVESRDELLTRLIVAGYTSLAEAVTTAHDAALAADPGDLHARWTAIGRSLRAWALAHPADFALLYGSPVPQYEAPAARTNDPGTRVTDLLLALAAEVQASSGDPMTTSSRAELAASAVGALLPTLDRLPDEVEAATSTGAGLSAVGLALGLSAWTLLLGAVTSEVFEQLGPVPDPEALFEWHLSTAWSLLSPG